MDIGGRLRLLRAYPLYHLGSLDGRLLDRAKGLLMLRLLLRIIFIKNSHNLVWICRIHGFTMDDWPMRILICLLRLSHQFATFRLTNDHAANAHRFWWWSTKTLVQNRESPVLSKVHGTAPGCCMVAIVDDAQVIALPLLLLSNSSMFLWAGVDCWIVDAIGFDMRHFNVVRGRTLTSLGEHAGVCGLALE